jgi:type I restriction enzyme S subunit
MSKHCTLKVPEDWEIVKLGDGKIVEDIYYGITAKAVDKNTGLRILRTTDIKNYSVDWDSLPYCEITEKRNDISKYLLKKGDLIVARAGTIGVSVLVEKDLDNIVFGSYLIKIKLKPDINPKFIHYFFQSSAYWNQIKKAQGSTLKNLNIPLLSSLQFFIPPAIEQQKIAEILSTIDEAIQKTNVIIAKTERLKKGLMKELLTGRIRVEEKDGKIVFRKETEFKDTEIGRIPKDWEVVKLGEVADINRECIDPTKKYPNKTFFYIDIDSVESGTGKIKKPKIIIGKSAPSRARRVIHEGDIIMSTVRPYLKAFALVPKEYDNHICSTGFAVLTCKGSILPSFLLNVLFSDFVIKQCNRMMVGGQYPAINQYHVSSIVIPLPSILEQQKIAEILLTIDKKLELERKRKEKLERIKKGLMDLLLTGKIRITHFYNKNQQQIQETSFKYFNDK